MERRGVREEGSKGPGKKIKLEHGGKWQEKDSVSHTRKDYQNERCRKHDKGGTKWPKKKEGVRTTGCQQAHRTNDLLGRTPMAMGKRKGRGWKLPEKVRVSLKGKIWEIKNTSQARK